MSAFPCHLGPDAFTVMPNPHVSMSSQLLLKMTLVSSYVETPKVGATYAMVSTHTLLFGSKPVLWERVLLIHEDN